MLPVSIAAQSEKERWQRVYTSEDSIIEIDESRVTFGSAQIGRVRFRTIFSQPQVLEEKSALKYKTRLETIEFRCAEKPADVLKIVPSMPIYYRLYEAELLDAKGKVLRTYEWDPSEDWRSVKFGSMMEKMSVPACKLIDEKRRNP